MFVNFSYSLHVVTHLQHVELFFCPVMDSLSREGVATPCIGEWSGSACDVPPSVVRDEWCHVPQHHHGPTDRQGSHGYYSLCAGSSACSPAGTTAVYDSGWSTSNQAAFEFPWSIYVYTVHTLIWLACCWACKQEKLPVCG